MTGEEPLPDPQTSRGVPRRYVVGLLCGSVVAAAGAPALIRGGGAPDVAGGIAGSKRAVLSRGRGTWTGTGTIAVLGLTRCACIGHPGRADHHSAVDTSVHPRHRVWPDVVTLDVEVHNGLASAVLFSPGQLRLRIGPDGPTVTPLAAGFSPGPAAGGSTSRTWVSFLAPADATDLHLQYSEPATPDVMVLALPAAAPHGRAS